MLQAGDGAGRRQSFERVNAEADEPAYKIIVTAPGRLI
jgi:hypothetical protein